MPRLSAPLVLLPAWLVMVACSPHSLRIGKWGSPALGDAPAWSPGVRGGHLVRCALPEFSWASGGGGPGS